MADWDSMGRAITQTRDRAFQTLSPGFSFSSKAFNFEVSYLA